MPIKELLKVMLQAYFVITTGITISMYVCCTLFSPNASIKPVEIGGILLMALISDLMFLIFYSKKELSKKQMLIRLYIHIPCELIFLLYFAHIWDWVNMSNPIEVLVFILLVIGIYVSVIAVTIYMDKKTADKLNEGLKKRYHS